MESDEFRKQFLEATQAGAEARETFLGEIFVEEVGNRLAEAEEVSDLEVCRFEGAGAKGRKLRVDGYSFDDADGSLLLLVADFDGEEQARSIGQADAKKSFGALRAFVEEAIAGRLTDGSIEESTPGFGLASDIRSRFEGVTRFRFYLATDGVLSTRVKDWPEEDLAGIPTEFHIWDMSRFHRAFQSATGRDDLDVDFAAFGGVGLSCLKAGAAEGEYEAYLCMIPGSVLAEVYEQYGSRLLEGNVRSFLSTKTKVNAGILRTIRDQPEMFFAYNNGIAATAESIELGESDAGERILKATNLQIVNGGQTTAALATCRRGGADLSRIYVQMKLSVVPGERSEELIPFIARYANYQNKVSEADFFSNHPFHIRMEEFSRRLTTPAIGGRQYGTHWFYERARGQYVNEQSKMTKPKRTQFQLQNPRAQLFNKTDVAKLENTWQGIPHKVSLGAQKNFVLFASFVAQKWEEDNTQFNEEYFRRVVALAILFRNTERLVSAQPWYQGGYRANIVTYTLAKLSDLIAREAPRRELDLRTIWERQAVPAEVEALLVEISKGVFHVLTSPDAGVQNVTEWAKKEACWTRTKELRVVLSEEFLSKLVSKDEVRTARKDAAKMQIVDSGIAAQSEVVKISGGEWKKMKIWAEAHHVVTPKESQFLDLATAIPRKLPTDKQSQVILEIRNKIIGEGYK